MNSIRLAGTSTTCRLYRSQFVHVSHVSRKFQKSTAAALSGRATLKKFASPGPKDVFSARPNESGDDIDVVCKLPNSSPCSFRNAHKPRSNAAARVQASTLAGQARFPNVRLLR